MTVKTALLVDIPMTLLPALGKALWEQDYQLLWAGSNQAAEIPLETEATWVPSDVPALQDWLERHRAHIDCLITATSLAVQIPPAAPVFYPPYPLYEYILKGMQKRGYGRVVNLYEGPGSARGLSLPQLEAVAARFEELIIGNDILFNSVNVEMPPDVAPEKAEAINTQRVDTIVWLATTEDSRPQMQFFRGYSDP